MSTSLVRSLVEASLLDELILAQFPVITGRGQDEKLFDRMSGPHRMDLVSADRTDTGVMVLTYARS